jgi:hypothetical protein
MAQVHHRGKAHELVYLLSELCAKYRGSREKDNSPLGMTCIHQLLLVSISENVIYQDRDVLGCHLIESEVPILWIALVVELVSFGVACFSAVSDPDVVLPCLQEREYQVLFLLCEEPCGTFIAKAVHEEDWSNIRRLRILVLVMQIP